MDYSLVTSVDPASNEMMATKENKSDSKPGNNVDATMSDEEKIADKEMKFESNEKVLSLSDISNNNKNECEYIEDSKLREKNDSDHYCHDTTEIQAPENCDTTINEGTFCNLNDSSKNSSSNCSRNLDYRLNLTSIEGTLLEAVPEDSPIPQMAVLEHCTNDKAAENLCNTMESLKECDNFTHETNTNIKSIHEQAELTPCANGYPSESKKDNLVVGAHLIPESNASDVSECSIATNATNYSQRDKYLSQILTKTEALTARQQVALWLTRTSMSDLSSMPSLKNIVYPPSVTAKEPPSRSSQSSHCSCYHHTHDKIYRKQSNSSSNCNRLSTAMSDCCFDGRTTTLNQRKHSSTSPSKVNACEGKDARNVKSTNIKRNHSTKSLIGGFSFGFRGMSSNKSFNDKSDKMCEENTSLLPSPIAFRKCETVIALTGANTDSPGNDTTYDGSGTYSSIATSTLIKRRNHQHYHNRPTSHSCSVNNVRHHCGHGSISPSVMCTPHASKKSSSLSLLKKLSSSKEKSVNRHKNHGNSSKNYVQSSSKQFHNGNDRDGSSYFGVSSNATIACESPHPGITPINRHRSNASIACSRCTSAFSMNASRMTSRATSQMSLLQMASCRRFSTAGSSITGYNITVNPTNNSSDDSKSQLPDILCKICLVEYAPRDMFKLHDCGCSFCRECLVRYVTMEVSEAAYEISCPDSECEKQDGKIQMSEIEILVGSELFEKHKSFRLDTEVALDSNRAWCPQAGCNTICHICTSTDTSGANQRKMEAVPVKCPSCEKEFCSLCSANWHPGLTCAQNGNALFASASNKRTNSNHILTNTSASNNRIVGPFGDAFAFPGAGSIEGDIKRCPMCNVPIERDAGCAQMMCKRCKHVFCWFCLTSLDEDFLLRHYDSGECKGLLGHTRASVLWHRAQVIGIFAGFGILLLIASPLLLMAAPCIFCCNCKTCQKVDGDGADQDGTTNNLKKGDSVIKDDNGVFGRFSSGFRIGGAVRKDSEDLISITSPIPQSTSSRFDTAATPPPSFIADPR